MNISAEAGPLLAAGAFDVTHDIERDHMAGVTALTHEVGSARLSAVTGACLAAGHIAFVCLWVGLAYLLLDVTTFPSGLESLGLVVSTVLVLLSLVLGVTGARRINARDGSARCRGDGIQYRRSPTRRKSSDRPLRRGGVFVSRFL